MPTFGIRGVMMALGRTDHGDVQATVVDAARGDVAALERIVAWHHRDMTRVCMVICGGDVDLAEDAVQAAWPIAWRALNGLRDPTRLRPWLVSIAANEARQLLRRQSRRRQWASAIDIGEIASDRHDPARQLDGADLGAALRRLPAGDRALLALKYVAGLDSAEIGRALNLSASGVRTRLERLLARLRKELGDE